MVYPNPAKAELNVQAQLDENATINLRNVLGQTLISLITGTANSTVKLDVSTLAAGVYYVELKSGSKTGVKQVIISQ